mmetsp:Transcript_5833/g.8459  ORF Transcript_5833/g.8459 Transcript_5833/m.8459 type:complete len:133 (-) Transcript_5833:192-590(-)
MTIESNLHDGIENESEPFTNLDNSLNANNEDVSNYFNIIEQNRSYAKCKYVETSNTSSCNLSNSISSSCNNLVMIIDSGATHHMSSDNFLFTSITFFPDGHRKVTLGDDTTKLSIKGYGTIVFKLDNKIIRL